MSSIDYLIRRLLQIIPVLFIVTIIVFFMIRLIPGSPAEVLLGDRATDDLVKALEKEMGLDKPIFEQYFIFLKNVFRGDLGRSIQYNTPVLSLLLKKMKVTVLLTLFSISLSVLVSIPIGYLAANNRDKFGDQSVRAFTLIALCMPQFWFGLVLMIIFSVHFRLLPVGGWGNTFAEQFKSLILPAITQALTVTALLTRNLRNNVVDILSMDYVDFAKSKGVSDKRIRNRHVNRNAMIPYVTLVSMRIAGLLGGSIIIENLFALPGMGALMSQSIFSRDYAVVQGAVLVFAFLVIIINIVTDMIYALLDPRVRLE